MGLEKLTPYVKDYLQKEWSDFWNVTYDEDSDRIDCMWNGIESTKIEFIYDYEDEELIFHSNEHQPVGELVEMLGYLNNKARELLNEFSNEPERWR